MNDEMRKILESKKAYRRQLAALPILEKLRMLDMLRSGMLEIAAVRDRRRGKD